MFVTPVGGTYYAHVGPGLTRHVDALLPALPEVERGMIIEAGEDEGVAARVAEGFAAAGIDVDALAKKLQLEGAESFVKSWKELMQSIADKSKTLATT